LSIPGCCRSSVLISLQLQVSTRQLKRLLQLRFDFDSTRQRKWPSWHHYSMLMKTRIHTRRHFTSKVCETAISTSTIEGCYPMLIRQRECHSYYLDVGPTLLRRYMSSPLPSHWLRRLSVRRKKMNMFIFRRSRIEAESQSNRNSRLS